MVMMLFPPFRISFFLPQLSFVPVGAGGLVQCCATGSLHTGTPSGREKYLYGLNTYTAEPTGIIQPKGIVVVLPDIFGWKLANSRIIADEMAKKGPFIVMLPDLMDGYVIPPSLLSSFRVMERSGILAFFSKIFHAIRMMYWYIPFRRRNTDEAVRSRLLAFLQGLQEQYPDMPVGTAGYCWGGKYTVELCTGKLDPHIAASETKREPKRPLVVCGFTAHPSQLVYPSDIEAVNLPLSVAAATIRDPMMTRQQGEQTKTILEEKTEQSGVRKLHEFVWYEGAHHGFAVRADENDKEEATHGKKADIQARKWFARWFDDARRKMNENSE